MLLLLFGASGAGKSSIREAIAADLEPAVTAVELRHLGAIPTTPDLEWRQRMAERAVLRAKALDEEGRHLLLAGDPVARVRCLPRMAAPPRPKPPTHAPRTEHWGLAAMKWSRLTNIPGDQWRLSIIDGSNMTKLEANQAVLRWITDAIDGRVPVFSRRGAPRPRSASTPYPGWHG
jgi:hypothetical protein